MATQQVKRMIGLPVEVNKPWANSTIAWGTGITKTPVPPSVSNPASLTPWVTTPKPVQPTFSDNIAKPIIPTTTPKPTVPTTTPPTPKPVAQGNPIGQNADGSYIYEQSSPATLQPTATPIVWVQPWMLDINDPNNYNLTGYTVDDYLRLDPASQLKANATWELQNKRLADTTNKLNYTNEVNAQKEFMGTQNTINQETAKLNNQNAEIARQQTMRSEEKSVRDLAQNIGFLWSWGRPVQSSWMMNAYADAISESNQKLSEIRTIQDNMRTMQELGIEFDANQYTEQIRRLNQDLKDKTGQVFQDAIAAYNNQERKGMVDSPAKMLKLQQEILARADFSVSWFIQKNLDDIAVMNNNITSHIEAVKEETARAEVLRKEKVEADALILKNNNTLDDKISAQRGYLYNANGVPMLNAQGGMIEYDPKAGLQEIQGDYLITHTVDANWNKAITMERLQPSDAKLLDMEKTRLEIDKLRSWWDIERKPSGEYDINGNQIWVNPKNPSQTKIQWDGDPVTTTTTKWVPISDAIAVALDKCKTGAQCWKFVNDILEEAWLGRLVQNSYLSKEQAIDKVWVALSNDQIWAGSIFAYPIDKSKDPNGYWHIGIVTGVNDDWTINIMDFNANKDEKKREVLNYDPNKVRNAGWTYSVPIISNQTVETTTKPVTPSEQAMYDKWAQYIGEKGGLSKKRYDEIAAQQPAWPTKDQIKGNASLQWRLKWDKRIDEYDTLKSSFDKLNSVATGGVNKKNKASVDQALIMLFNKVLDPNSVVKEGEYARSQEWQAFFDWLAAKYNQYVYGGQGIDDNTRNEMIAVVWDLKKAADDWFVSVKQQYLDTAWDVWATEDFVNNYFKSYEGWQPNTISSDISSQWFATSWRIKK